MNDSAMDCPFFCVILGQDGIVRLTWIPKDAYHRSKLLDKFSLSLGVTCLPDHGNDARTLLRAVGQALYRAKKEERDRVVAA